MIIRLKQLPLSPDNPLPKKHGKLMLIGLTALWHQIFGDQPVPPPIESFDFSDDNEMVNYQVSSHWRFLLRYVLILGANIRFSR
jgi:hypothetical protein